MVVRNFKLKTLLATLFYLAFSALSFYPVFASEAALTNIEVSSGVLSPSPFDSGTYNYKINDFKSSTITVTTTYSDGKKNNINLNLSCGWSDHNLTSTYTLAIYRTCNDNNNLRSLQLSTGAINFKPNETSYTVNVNSSISSFKATGYAESNLSKVTYTPAQTINLVTGKNILKVNVTAENGTTKTYTIYINKAGEETKKDGNSTLSSLEISSGTLNFNKDIKDYTVTIPYETKNVTIKATTASSKANINISELNELIVGENKATVTVTAEDGSVSKYNITIIRQEEGAGKLNADSSLIALIINDQYFLIDPTDTSQKITIQNTIQKANIVAIPNQKKSTTKIVADDDEIDDQDVVRVIVTAEDGSTTTYILNFSFPYETTTVDIKEQKPINYILIIIIAVVALAIIGVLIYLALTAGNKKPKTPIQNSPQNPGRWYNN